LTPTQVPSVAMQTKNTKRFNTTVFDRRLVVDHQGEKLDLGQKVLVVTRYVLLVIASHHVLW
jgi:hypothetical protein